MDSSRHYDLAGAVGAWAVAGFSATMTTPRGLLLPSWYPVEGVDLLTFPAESVVSFGSRGYIFLQFCFLLVELWYMGGTERSRR